jgi:hypothetical protein
LTRRPASAKRLRSAGLWNRRPDTPTSGAHDAARICLPCLAMAGMPGSAGKCSRCLVPAHGRRRPRRGTAIPYNRVSQTLPRQTRHCNTRRLFSTIMARHPCDLSAAYSPDDPIRHERQVNFTAALVHTQRSQRRHHVVFFSNHGSSARIRNIEKLDELGKLSPCPGQSLCETVSSISGARRCNKHRRGA